MTRTPRLTPSPVPEFCEQFPGICALTEQNSVEAPAPKDEPAVA